MVDRPFLDQMEKVARKGGQRWRGPDGDRWYEWDRLHGHVEVYDKRGNHLGAADPMTGQLIGRAKPGRTIDV